MSRNFVAGLAIGGVVGYLIMKVQHNQYVADVYKLLIDVLNQKIDEKKENEEVTE